MAKTSASDLALFGKQPAFKDALHVGLPDLGNRQKFLERLGDILDRKWLTNQGAYVNEFEQRIGEYVGVEHCVAMCNATVALEILIRALGMTSEIIVPSFTFVATAHALEWQGVRPVFCDIDPRTHTLDSHKVEQTITPRTTGIVGVHLWGNPCHIDALASIAKRHDLKLLFDASHAFGCSYKGRMIGGFGDAEVFSFHATKFVNSLEGGAVVTNNEELAQRLRLMRNFGFTSYDKVDSLGTNGKMNEVSAAMGLTNLESIDEFIEINRHNYKQYESELAGVQGVTILSYDEKEKHNYQYVVVEIDEEKTILTRDQILRVLHAENILARRYFHPGCHRMEPYRSLYPTAHLFLPETERVASRVISLPTGQAITLETVSKVCDIIRSALENAERIRNFLGEKPPA